MINFSEYLNESKEGKNLHLEHIEDSILNDGVRGGRDSINFLQSLRDMLAGHSEVKVNITTKWDGAPAIFAGINPENKKFFVGTKGIFAGNAKLNYTPSDIDKNHPGDGLNAKLKLALQYLPELNIKGVIQGDMMFTHSDLKTTNIEGVNYLTFQPNTILYAIPNDSHLAKTIRSVKLGVVWHTSYVGNKMSDMKASFGVNISGLSPSKNVWYRDASFVDASGTATFTADETKQINNILSQAGSLFRTISSRTLAEIATSDTYKIQIKTWNNSKIRSGEGISDTAGHVGGLLTNIEMKLNREILAAKKSDTRRKRELEKNLIMSFYKRNRGELKKIFDFQNLIVLAKNMIIRKLENVKNIGTFIRTADGFKVTAPEGFVVIDHLKGNAIKLVDRMEFSHNNFNAAKEWTK